MIFDALGNVGDMMKKAKDLQKNMKDMKEELKNTEIVEDSGGVKVVVSGDMELKEFKISPEVLENDKDRIEFLIGDSVKKAYLKARDEATSKMKKVAGGISIPGLM